MPTQPSRDLRALIIAIEEYASAQSGMTRRLEGNHAAAAKFRTWLIEEKGVPPENIIFCAESATVSGRTHGATANDVSLAVHSLWKAGKGQTRELHFFFSGHGFLYEESEARNQVADVLVCSEFVDAEISGNACRKLHDIKQHLRSSMGPGEHFYFINACRNKIKEGEIAPGVLGLQPQRATNGDANPFVLYSAQPGSFANANQRFSESLMEGLKGTDIAMTWANSDLVVSFSSLERFLKARISEQEVDSRPGRGPGIIRKIVPIPQFVCTVEVEGAGAGDRFEVRVMTGRGQTLQLAQDRFSGPRFDLPPLGPDKYIVTVVEGGGELVPTDSAAVELFGHRTIGFRRADRSATPPQAEEAGMASVRIASVPAGEIQIRDLLSGRQDSHSLTNRSHLSQLLQPGRYEFSLTTPDGRLLKRREVQLSAGQSRWLTLKPSSRRPVKQAIRSKFGLGSGRIDFSESLGEIADHELAVWLSILGASRIIGGPGQYGKLAGLPLARFDDAREGDAPIFVLSALRLTNGPVRFALSGKTGQKDWVKASSVEGFPGLQQIVLETRPGPQLLSYAKPGGASHTLVTHTLANRATLVTISDSESELRIHQYILPIWRLRERCPPHTREALWQDPLDRVLQMARAQGRYGRQEFMAPEEEAEEVRFWNELLYVKWLDPLTAVLAAYELVRRGRLENMATVASNLRRHFAGLPDTEILAGLAGLEAARVAAVPLVLDGLLTQSETIEFPLPETLLDYTGMWTAWRGAVKVGRGS